MFPKNKYFLHVYSTPMIMFKFQTTHVEEKLKIGKNMYNILRTSVLYSLCTSFRKKIECEDK